MKKKVLLAAVAAGMVVAGLGGTFAVAGHEAGSSLTGCLTRGGALVNLNVGDRPTAPCGASQTQVHFGSGDVTAVGAGTGLTGGGESGAVSVALAEGYRLPQDCGPGQVAKAGAAWWCADDDDTTYSAGSGLSLNGKQFSVDTSAIQSRVGGSCAAGSAVRQIGADGSVVCETDDDTTYSGADFVLSNQACAVGKLVTGFSASGAVLCADAPQGGTFSSPNGLFSIEVKDTGIELKGPSASVKVGVGSAELSGPSGLVRTSATTTIQGSLVTLNGCAKPVARKDDSVSAGSSPMALTGYFDPATAGYVLVPDFLGIRLVIDGHHVPTVDGLDNDALPTIDSKVTVPLPAFGVLGSVTSGSATVCAGP